MSSNSSTSYRWQICRVLWLRLAVRSIQSWRRLPRCASGGFWFVRWFGFRPSTLAIDSWLLSNLYLRLVIDGEGLYEGFRQAAAKGIGDEMERAAEPPRDRLLCLQSIGTDNLSLSQRKEYQALSDYLFEYFIQLVAGPSALGLPGADRMEKMANNFLSQAEEMRRATGKTLGFAARRKSQARVRELRDKLRTQQWWWKP